MATLIEQPSPAMTIGPIVGRGIAAAHGALAGAFFLFLLHAPSQVLSALAVIMQTEWPRRAPDDTTGMLLSSLASVGSFALALAVFFLFPLVQGGILGQVRNRLTAPDQPPGDFGAYGRAFYGRLLGSLALFTLPLSVMIVPMVCMVGIAFYALTPEAPPPEQEQFARLFLSYPLALAGIVIFAVLASAIGMVYWVANCIIASTPAGVFAAWRQSLHFCRQNILPCVTVWLLLLGVSSLISPVGLAAQLGLVSNPWAVTAVALLYAALLGYLGVLFAALVMSLYLGRRAPSGPPIVPEL
jgi:hypothetical protein